MGVSGETIVRSWSPPMTRTLPSGKDDKGGAYPLDMHRARGR